MLSDFDFELLIQDLLQRELGFRLESFKRGRDKGIDLRYSVGTNDQGLIIQCKHYANSKFSNLKSDLKTREIEKIRRLNPSRYILVTSLGLTPNQKDELFEILSEHCKSINDIYGKEDLNNLLRNFPEIEKSHHKLWFTSSNIMDRIIHSSVYNKSEIYLDKISEKLKIYVPNKAYSKALNIIKKSNVCIISGIPGIGKTTLAEMLLITHLEMGYEIIKISQNISEAHAVLSSGKKQIFFYDDFLGQTGFDIRQSKNEDSEILTFIGHVEKNKNSKFILTTREYILNQAIINSESFQRASIDINKLILELEDYSDFEKARILYNHLYYNQVPKQYIENLLKNNVMAIINHKNYSPRIIEVFTDNLRPENPDEFYHTFIVNLDNPRKIWDTAFRNHLSEESRNLLLLLSTSGVYEIREKLRKKFDYYNSEKSKFYNRKFNESDFINALKELEVTFINNDGNKIEYSNPSVRDYIEGYIIENDKEFEHLCDYSISYSQCVSLFNIAKKDNFKIFDKHKEPFVEAILSCITESEFSYGFSLCQRVITLMDMNKYLNSNRITHYISENFLSNLHLNFDYYDVTIKDCNELLKASNSKSYSKYFDSFVTKGIIDFVIDKVLNENIYDLKTFEIVEVIKEIEPTVSDSIEQDVQRVFKDFSDNLDVFTMDWNGEGEISEYYDELEKFGEFFEVSVDEHLYDLNELLDEFAKYENDDNYSKWDHDLVSKFTDTEILNMFESLLE